MVDSSICTLTCANATKVEIESMDVPDDEMIRTLATHFGPYFKEDNKRVITMLKKLLLN